MKAVIVIFLSLMSAGSVAVIHGAQGGVGGAALVVEAPGKAIRLPRRDWVAMTNEFEWASNFEQQQRESRQLFGRVVTVFKLPMSTDRRLGSKLSENEYLELFVVHPESITARLRVDKGRYWVMSRDTYSIPADPSNSFYDRQLSQVISDGAIGETEFALVHQGLQPQIDSTRYLLQQLF